MCHGPRSRSPPSGTRSRDPGSARRARVVVILSACRSAGRGRRRFRRGDRSVRRLSARGRRVDRGGRPCVQLAVRARGGRVAGLLHAGLFLLTFLECGVGSCCQSALSCGRSTKLTRARRRSNRATRDAAADRNRQSPSIRVLPRTNSPMACSGCSDCLRRVQPSTPRRRSPRSRLVRGGWADREILHALRHGCRGRGGRGNLTPATARPSPSDATTSSGDACVVERGARRVLRGECSGW